MPRRRLAKPTPDASMTEAALDAMDADELRALLHDIIPWLDESTHARLVNALVDRAARSPSGWVPDGPTDAVVTEIVAFAEAAKGVGSADPSDVDDYLRQGSNAFLRKDYSIAYQIFRALLLPVGNVDIDLGQHEMLDEVLGVDVAACARCVPRSSSRLAPRCPSVPWSLPLAWVPSVRVVRLTCLDRVPIRWRERDASDDGPLVSHSLQHR